MRFLFIHQNFPGQFRHIAQELANNPQHEVVGIGDVKHVAPGSSLHSRISVAGYPSPKEGSPQTHPYLREAEGHARRGQRIFRAALQLRKDRGFEPDVVVVHPGWGEALFLREAFPSARLVHYCEYFYHVDGGDAGFDPEFPATLDERLRMPLRNSTQLVGLTQCDVGVSPTPWQWSRYPAEFRPKIRVLHEGIDAARVQPDPHAVLKTHEHTFRAGEEIVTFVARNLEPYRGFHGFMRALPRMQALRPSARFIVVGGDEISYGRNPPAGHTYRQKYSAEVHHEVDWSKVHFLGKLPYLDYMKVLQVSAAHVYLTYPFVLSWSMLEAMAAGCLVIGSATPPVQDVLTDGENGMLVDFFDADALAGKVADALAHPQEVVPMRQQARRFIIQHYDLRTRCLPQWREFLVQR